MRKWIILIFASIAVVNTSYASFPVLKMIQEGNIEIVDDVVNKGGVFFAVLSVALSLLSVLFIFLFIGNGFAHNGNPYPYLLLSIISIIGTISSAVQAKKRRLKSSKSFIGISILIVSLLLIMSLFFI
jgi:hypothetical protein